MTRSSRSSSRSGGTPIEDAPPWMLAIFAALLWLVAWPALAGFMAAWGAWRGQRGLVAAAALAVAVLVVVGLATGPRWRRPMAPTLHDPRPFFVRFSTWLWTALLLPNVLYGIAVLAAEGDPPGPQAALLLGAIVSALHGAFALAARLRAAAARGRHPR